MPSGAHYNQIEVQGRGGVSSVRLGAGHDDTRARFGTTPVSVRPASPPFPFAGLTALAGGKSVRGPLPPRSRTLADHQISHAVGNGVLGVAMRTLGDLQQPRQRRVSTRCFSVSARAYAQADRQGPGVLSVHLEIPPPTARRVRRDAGLFASATSRRTRIGDAEIRSVTA